MFLRFNWDFIYRKKNVNSVEMEETKLARVLNTFDLTMLGIGCTFGSGVYILIGNVIANYSGPSIILSFLIAGIASFLSGMCYAELGARVPRSGSAYTYIYVTIGEFVAFIIGWDLILEYMIGAAGTANALSQYINSLCDNKIKNALKSAMPMNIHGLGSYPDFLAFGIIIIVTVFLIIGVKESANMNKLFVFLNTIIISFIVIVGGTQINTDYWHLDKSDIARYSNYSGRAVCDLDKGNCGEGGFFPFGFYGMIKGTAKCFYAYIGFDCIATTGEEVKNPLKALPLSILITLVVCTVVYLGASTVITLMIPYFLIDTHAPLPSAFAFNGIDWAKYIVSIGATASLATCLYSSMFPMPRVVYSIASDGLIFKSLAKVLPKVHTPAVATIVTGFLTAVLAAIFDLDQLIEMTSIGTLLAYSLVSTCVIILRYRPTKITAFNEDDKTSVDQPVNQSLFKRLFTPSSTCCNKTTAGVVNGFTLTSVALIVVICLVLTFDKHLEAAYSIILLILFILSLFICMFIIWRQPQNTKIETFKIPFVPFFPLLCVFINTYLMMSLETFTWVRFIVWFAIGFMVYFGYGIRNSLENKNPLRWFPCIEFSRNYGPSTSSQIPLDRLQNN